jgi:3-phenylpropionate/trans-cinnamate dioxygenase ferredoxin reductase subunit
VNIVVVGASLAGLTAAEALRANGFDGELTLIGDEPHEPYDRPPLSKAVISGRLTTDRIQLPRVRDVEARWLLGVAATSMDLAKHTVSLADGRAVGFDRVLIATGARARPWHDTGQAALRGVHVLRGRDDADRLRADLAARPRRVLVVGGGFTGSEVASSCRDLGLAVTMTQRDTAALRGALGCVVGGAIGDVQRAHGVDLRVDTTVLALAGDAGRLRRARLSDGDVLDVDVAVVALGSLPNTEWLRGSGVLADRHGVTCAADCRAVGTDGAPLQDVFAAGDVARWTHPLFPAEPTTRQHWGNAVDQADTAARTMLGIAPAHGRPALPAFWSDQFGLNIKSVGMPTVADEVVLTQGSFERGSFVAAYGERGRLVGAVAVNSPRVLDGYGALIEASATFPPVLNASDGPGDLVPVDADFPRALAAAAHH